MWSQTHSTYFLFTESRKLISQKHEFKIQYNFFKNKISDYNSELFIKEISSDRTELRVCSTTFTNIELETKVTELINQATKQP